MRAKLRKYLPFCDRVIKGVVMLLAAVLLTDPVALVSLQKPVCADKMPMMCTCSTCRKTTGVCRCYMHCMIMMSKTPAGADREQQICICDSQGTPSMIDYYFPRYFPQREMTIRSPETGFTRTFPSNSLLYSFRCSSGIFHPPRS